MTDAHVRTRRSLATALAAALVLSLLALAPPAQAQAQAAQHSTTFQDSTPGQLPTGWTSRWQPAWWQVEDTPRRLVQAPTQTARTLLSYDAPGDLAGVDVELSTVVQIPGENVVSGGGGRFDLYLNATGEPGAETAYLFEITGDDELRIGELRDGEYTSLAIGSAGEIQRYTWYHVVFGREGNTVRAKLWAYGQDEPEGWQVEHTAEQPLPADGWVGLGGRNAGTNPSYSDFAFFGVGAAGEDAPRAPVGLVEVAGVPAAPATGVTAAPSYGFTTVRWEPILDQPALLTEYHIYRVAVDAEDNHLGEPVHTGIWRPNRYTYTGVEHSFADAGFEVGERYGWAVRAVTAAGASELSEFAYADTVEPPSPGPEYRTGFEQRLADEGEDVEDDDEADWTHYEEELAFNNRVEANSDRVRLETVGQSHLGRDIVLWVIGDPPPASPEANDKPVVLINCLVHGPEPSGREACMMLVRELAFSDSEWVTSILETSTVLVVPAINRDGTHARPQTRGNAHDNQDLNRDHSLLREPETLALARVLRDWEPGVAIDGHHYGSNDVGDLPLLWSRNYMADDELVEFTQDHFVLGHLFSNAADVGWWPQPYPIGYNEETILRNTLGVKNIVGVLLESRSGPGPTRPGETTQEANRRRHTYSHLWTYRELLSYHRDHHEAVAEVREDAIAENIANEGPLVLHGARPTPRHSPPDREIHPTTIIEEPPCGYLITEEQYTERPSYGEGYEHFGLMPSVQTRLDAHGIAVEQTDEGIFVPLGQPLRGLVALLLDPAAPGQTEEDVPGSYQGPFLYSGQAQRVMTCPDEPAPEGVTRLSGSGRVETAIRISQESYGEGEASAVVLARADEYPDALAGTPLAVAVDGPLLITSSNQLLPAVTAEIQRVLPAGGTVHLLGGDAALDGSVEQQVDALGFEVDRIAGASRIETAVEIADRLHVTVDDGAQGQPLLLTTGYNYPDALAAGAAAAALEGAVLLTAGEDAHPALDAYLATRDDASLWAVGGPATRAYPDATAVSGATRDHTAVEVAEAFFEGPSVVGFARNDSYPDALAGGALVGRRGGPLLLTAPSTLSAPAAAYLGANATVTSALLFGGDAAISTGVAGQIGNLLGG